MSRFTNDTFEESSKTTIGVAFATKNLAVDVASEPGAKETRKQVKLQVWDTGMLPGLCFVWLTATFTDATVCIAGQERYRALSSA